jgi:hypothetical protein
MTTQNISATFSARAVRMARRINGVRRSELAKLAKNIGWFTYLQRAALTTETVTSVPLGRDVVYFVR